MRPCWPRELWYVPDRMQHCLGSMRSRSRRSCRSINRRSRRPSGHCGLQCSTRGVYGSMRSNCLVTSLNLDFHELDKMNLRYYQFCVVHQHHLSFSLEFYYILNNFIALHILLSSDFYFAIEKYLHVIREGKYSAIKKLVQNSASDEAK